MTVAITQASEDVKQLGLPDPDQIGFVVRDLDKAVAQYDPIFGPFHKGHFGPQQASYRGGEPSAYDLKFAFGRIGPLEIELIEWVAGDTPHGAFLAQGREGMHHLRFRVDDLQHWAGKLASIGFEQVWFGRLSDAIAYGYYERDGDPLVLELLQYPRTGDPTIGNGG